MPDAPIDTVIGLAESVALDDRDGLAAIERVRKAASVLPGFVATAREVLSAWLLDADVVSAAFGSGPPQEGRFLSKDQLLDLAKRVNTAGPDEVEAIVADLCAMADVPDLHAAT